jgi:hypothetical protein
LVGAAPVLLGSDRSLHDYFVECPGEMLRIKVAAWSAAVDRSASLHKLLLRWIPVHLVQTAQTAFANASFTVEAMRKFC